MKDTLGTIAVVVIIWLIALSNDYSWQSAGFKYTRRIQITNNQLASQIIEAARELGEAYAMKERLQVACILGGNCADRVRIWTNRIAIIEADIRKLASGKTINEHWPMGDL